MVRVKVYLICPEKIAQNKCKYVYTVLCSVQYSTLKVWITLTARSCIANHTRIIIIKGTSYQRPQGPSPSFWLLVRHSSEPVFRCHSMTMKCRLFKDISTFSVLPSTCKFGIYTRSIRFKKKIYIYICIKNIYKYIYITIPVLHVDGLNVDGMNVKEKISMDGRPK
jgi:hypothetical protein